MESKGKEVKKDTLAFGEPRSAVGNEGDILHDTLEVCPHCKGNGFVSNNPTNNSMESFTISESTIRSVSSRRHSLARHPQLHLPSLGENLNPTPSCSSRKSQGAGRHRLARLPPLHLPSLGENLDPTPSCSSRVDRNLEEVLRRAVLKLSGVEWEVKRAGLQECLQIAQHHPDDVQLHMNQVYRAMRFLVTNHRARDTLFVCQVARKYFAHLRSSCRPEFDEFVIALLARTADSSLKVRCYVNDALEKMVTYMPAIYALRPLVEKGCQHQNPLVRTATVKLISDLVMFRTPLALLTYPYLRESCQKIVEVGAKMLVDNSSTTRAEAKTLFLKLVNHKDFFVMYDSCSIENELKKKVDRILFALRDNREDDI